MQKTSTVILQGTRLTPQQIMAATMIQSTNDELQKIIDEALEKNIVLEIDETRSVDQLTEKDERGEENLDEPQDNPEEADYEDDISDEDGENYQDDVKDIPLDYVEEDDLPGPINEELSEKAYSPLVNVGVDTSFRESLKAQISVLDIDGNQRFLANYLVDSLEDDGYLRRPLYELVDDLAWHQNYDTTEAELESVLVDIVQGSLEPAGIGARDLRECLILQLLDKKQSPEVLLAYKLVDEAFDEISNKRYNKLPDRFGISQKELDLALRVIRHLDPRPGGGSSSVDTFATKATQIRPDFIVTVEDDETLSVSLCDCRVPAVRISSDYDEMLKEIQKDKSRNDDIKKGKAMIEEHIRNANIFIRALIQRRNTLLGVMRVIVSNQREFFLTGKIDTLKPMTLKNISDISGYDISTISRVSNSKYVQTVFGTYAIRELFTSAVSINDGEIVSNAAIKDALNSIVKSEDKRLPLTDDQLVKALADQGYSIARRTVVKYREELGIPKSNLRKKI